MRRVRAGKTGAVHHGGNNRFLRIGQKREYGQRKPKPENPNGIPVHEAVSNLRHWKSTPTSTVSALARRSRHENPLTENSTIMFCFSAVTLIRSMCLASIP